MRLFKNINKIKENIHFILPILITVDGVLNESISTILVGVSVLCAFVQIRKNFERIKNCQPWY
jgi:hypothetical protein